MTPLQLGKLSTQMQVGERELTNTWCCKKDQTAGAQISKALPSFASIYKNYLKSRQKPCKLIRSGSTSSSLNGAMILSTSCAAEWQTVKWCLHAGCTTCNSWSTLLKAQETACVSETWLQLWQCTMYCICRPNRICSVSKWSRVPDRCTCGRPEL